MNQNRTFRSRMLNKLLTTESEWNPKVALSRAVFQFLPDKWLMTMKKFYYPRLLNHSPGLPANDDSIVRHLVSRGDSVIDVGAAIGQYTRFLSRSVEPTGIVYSFEPLPPTFEILTSNVQKLGLKNVKLFNCAISDSEGVTAMVVPLYRWGSECYYDARIGSSSEKAPLRQFQVATRTIDSIFRGCERNISFIKCDVNYHEFHFIRGALQTIRQSNPAMLIEVGTNPDESVATRLREVLGNEGYQAYHFDGAKLRVPTPGVRNQDWFFLRSSHLELLNGKCPHLLAI